MSRRRKLAVGLAIAWLVLVGVPLAWLALFGPETFEDLDLGRVPDAAVESARERAEAEDQPFVVPTTPRGRETFLLFSVGAAGMSEEDAARIGIVDVEDREEDDGNTDTLIVVVSDADTGRVALLSIPRDTWVFERGRRINATFKDHGPQALVDDVSELTGLAVDHLVQVNFAAFADLVDAVGGVALEVDRPLADVSSVLYVPAAGCWRFDGPAALGYARSRMTLTVRDGAWRTDTTANDLDRTQRQQRLLGALWDQLRGPSLVLRVPDLLSASRGLRYDADLGVGDAVQLARVFSSVSAGTVEGYTLPTVPRTISGAAAQVVDEDAAAPVLRRLQDWPPDGVAEEETLTLGAAVPASAAARDGAVLAADATPCTLASARDLPEPHGFLAEIWRAQQRGRPAPGPDTP